MSSAVAERLRQQASYLIERFTDRVYRLKEHSEFNSMTRGVDMENTLNEGLEFFPKGKYLAVGIDGSMDYDERLEMLLFYVCATAFRCPIEVNDNSIHVNLKLVERDSKLSVSAAIPLWLEDISDVSGILDSSDTDFEFKMRLERIPFALMTLGELSIALDAIESKDTKVVFLDRPISGTFGPTLRDLRLLLRIGESSLTEFNTPYGKLSMLDISLASILGAGDIYVPRRGPYLVYAAIQVLIKEGEMKNDVLAKRLGLDDKGIGRVMKRLERMDKRYGNQLIERSDILSIKLRDDVKGYWDRVMATMKEVRRRIFESRDHPLQISDSRWLTVLDLSAINTFLIYELYHQSIKKNVLVIGIAKDTSASDFTRSIIPHAIHEGMLKANSPLPNLKNDRAFLTVMAVANSESIKTPWRTIGYDTCFTTLIVGSDPKVLLRAARKHVSRERLFIKSYFQLRTFATDRLIRSPVFLYDRFYNPRIDSSSSIHVNVLEQDKVVQIEPYFEGIQTNPLDNLILYILSQSDNPEVLEALGHNQLLYLADKAVKAEVKLMRGMLRGIADFQLSSLARREKIIFSRTFRDFRMESELRRSRSAQEAK